MSRVLLVEDDELIGRSLKYYLTRSGYVLDWVRSGDDVIGILGQFKFELILLDIMIPGLNGFEVLTKLKSITEYADIPVIVMSNLSSDEDKNQAKSLGAVDFLVKAEVDYRDLVRKIKDKYWLGFKD